MESAQHRLNEAFRTSKKIGRIRQKNESIIIQAAEVEFAKNGFKGTSLNAVAKRAGLPKSNILYYFKSKHGLYGALLADILVMWNQSFNDITVDSDPAQVLYSYIEEKIHYSSTHPLASKIFATEIIQGAPHLEPYLSDDLGKWVKERASVIQAWIDAGKIKPIQPIHLIFLIWSSTQHYADFATQIQWALGKEAYEPEDFEQATKTIATIILGGLGLSVPQ
ncbi:TetR/AcrR family transcriptional regulator [Reinekea thalattae]|uniref:TetR family transcriptional regulator n=1 Tax=Reinekea thalattae TaxID=2593301 RepID=A0A5C8Z9H4_9GAMM|nr:TetR/AcrR family transcriptional regulator [Reinekea thalattae]TXR53801.1 TetR family transcriptional regulator [Reinekea thalattae]